MPEFSTHVPGTFCWPELATSDQQAATAFYSALFGWEADTQPIGPTETYTMFKVRSLEVGAASTLRLEERQHGVPPHWNTFVTVADADATAARARELGGTVLAPPFDVMDAGRMAVLRDPTGAVLSVWQPGLHIGARILREPGSLGWTELTTRDTAAAEKFYTQLFGWKAKAGDAGGQQYTEFTVDTQPQGGMMAMDSAWGNVPPHWMPYFQVNDCDGAVAKTEQLGGRVHVPATDIPSVGRFAMLADPQGAMFSVIAIASRS
jgi:predicted enzyme related to lactoylglutathione lyase